jgi:thymidine phosphorylase
MIAVGVGSAARAWRLTHPSIRPDAPALGRAMVKETKFFRKQAAKAERVARTVSDAEMSERFLNMAKAYRSQADVLKAKKKFVKAKKKSGKKRR